MKKTYNLILEVELKKEITEGIFDNFIDNKLIATETWLNENYWAYGSFMEIFNEVEK